MYTIINKTQGKNFKLTGDWPSDIIEYMLNNGDDIIVISSYSNTIKVPVKYKDEWLWKDYTYSVDIFTNDLF
jgi:hypothetical protein